MSIGTWSSQTKRNPSQETPFDSIAKFEILDSGDKK
jgi:hypothetical protein